MSNTISQQPPPVKRLIISFPAPRVVLVTLNRPKKLNAIDAELATDLNAVWPWFDKEPSLSVAVLTGAGRAFCAGADLEAWRDRQAGVAGAPAMPSLSKKEAAEMILSRRKGKKPVIAAVNGLAHGGGCEMVVNCDIVVAADTAELALPEVKRGLAPIGGCMPRLIRTIGLQRASELVMTGRPLSAQEAMSWGLVNKVVPVQDVVPHAIQYASTIAAHSPDAIICARAGIRESWYQADVEDAVQKTLDEEFAALQKGENMLEGLQAFVERRSPRWKGSKL